MRNKYQEIKKRGISIFEETQDYSIVLSKIFKEGASFEMTLKVLIELGLDSELVDKLVQESIEWKNHSVSFEKSFFNFVEIDDDLIC